jgi:hypothetical protein
MSDAAIDEFLQALVLSELPLPNGWSFRSAKEAHVSTGETFLLIRWEPKEDSERLKAKFAFKTDRTCPLLSLVFNEANMLKEIEIWSGEPMSFKALPRVTDLRSPAELGWQDKSSSHLNP